MGLIVAIARTLPTYYYHSHFVEFLQFIEGANEHLLNTSDHEFIKVFNELDKRTQCVLVRLVNRKHPYIKLSSVKYEELGDIARELSVLTQCSLIRSIELVDVPAFLDVLTKAELLDIISSSKVDSIGSIKSSSAKAVILEACTQISPTFIVNSDIAHQFIVRQFDAQVDYFLYLYFGYLGGQLSQFSMRDLGIMRAQGEFAQMQSRFSYLHDAKSCFELAHYKRQLKYSVVSDLPSLLELFTNLPQASNFKAKQIKSEITLSLAKQVAKFDKQKALELVEFEEADLTQEFWCRQAYALGYKEAVEKRLNQILDNSYSEYLLMFAEGFLARKYKQKRTSVLTDMLRQNTHLFRLDEQYKGMVEYGLSSHYQTKGLRVCRTENRIWRNLFGLVLWPLLFETQGCGLATAFDRIPLCLNNRDINLKNAPKVYNYLEKLASKQALIDIISQHSTRFYGTKQGVIHWHPNILEELSILVNGSSLSALQSQLAFMYDDYLQRNDGFPDIMVLSEEGLRFEEIKAEGDSLRPNQVLQIQQLRKLGWSVDITRVEWVVDPYQPYAVVDIETTGGRSDTHKITEIGIVKIIDNEVVDSFQSLINPQRHIPSAITQLTGISNQMVVDAPIFEEVADIINEFTEGCIFVAHNVNFDYGFVKNEFERLSVHYRRPKLCTVQQMRKYYKGLKSYSLSNLCKYFDIQMTRHHRAMSDAQAAAELLKLVNNKRLISNES